MRPERRRFQCVDEDGNEHTVVELQRMIRTEVLDEPIAYAPGSADYRDSLGRPVALLDDGTFQIATTGQILRKV